MKSSEVFQPTQGIKDNQGLDVLIFPMCQGGSLREQGILLFSHFPSSQGLIFQQRDSEEDSLLWEWGSTEHPQKVDFGEIHHFHGIGIEQRQGRKNPQEKPT